MVEMEEKLMFAEANMAKRFLSKRGLSGVITTVLMIALVLAAVAIVWGIVNNTLKDQVESSQSCFGNFDKVTLNRIYTCYDLNPDSDPLTDDGIVQFSLSIGDIEVDEVIVSIAAGGTTGGYTITNLEDETDTNLANYNPDDEIQSGFGTDLIKLPGKTAGKTYVAQTFTSAPDLIQIAPVLNGQQCEVSDTISSIEPCM
jgi:flagellin-like protein